MPGEGKPGTVVFLLRFFCAVFVREYILRQENKFKKDLRNWYDTTTKLSEICGMMIDAEFLTNIN